jgi:hypothetical protein
MIVSQGLAEKKSNDYDDSRAESLSSDDLMFMKKV